MYMPMMYTAGKSRFTCWVIIWIKRWVGASFNDKEIDTICVDVKLWWSFIIHLIPFELVVVKNAWVYDPVCSVVTNSNVFLIFRNYFIHVIVLNVWKDEHHSGHPVKVVDKIHNMILRSTNQSTRNSWSHMHVVGYSIFNFARKNGCEKILIRWVPRFFSVENKCNCVVDYEAVLIYFQS